MNESFRTSHVLNDSFKTFGRAASHLSTGAGPAKPGDFAGALTSGALNESFMASRARVIVSR